MDVLLAVAVCAALILGVPWCTYKVMAYFKRGTQEPVDDKAKPLTEEEFTKWQSLVDGWGDRY